jgi:RNA polymerase sigma factor (sigma-70 family)
MRVLSTTLLRDFGVLYRDAGLGALPDDQLLERFNGTNGHRDHAVAELAFAALVQRHGSMVWHVCRALLRDPDDADDAFQATFLVLVQKSRSLRFERRSLGPWLHGVAYRVGRKALCAKARRRSVEHAAAEGRALYHQRSQSLETEMADLTAVLHQEIMRLPERYRSVVVLCELEGLSYLQAADRLKLPLGTVQSRLARARQRLRGRLVERTQSRAPVILGLDEAGPTLSGVLGLIRPPVALVRRTCRLAELSFANSAFVQSTISSAIPSLAEKGSRVLALPRKAGLAAILTTSAVLSTVVFFQNRTAAQPRQDGPRPSPQSPPVARPRAQNQLRAEAAVQVDMPAPKELNTATGRGKILVYALDAGDNRIRRIVPDGDVRNPGGQLVPPIDPGPRRRRRTAQKREEISWQETTREISWAVVTGVVDHRATQAIYSKGGDFTPRPLDPDWMYQRVDLQRQIRNEDGAWSGWKPVALEQNYQILDNLPEVEAEKTPDELRPSALVDPLPFLREGSWRGVDVERLRAIPREENKRGPIGAPGDDAQEIRLPAPAVLMMRSFDFTVEPGRTYRYRSRLWFWNSPERDLAQANMRPQFHGPWSEPTHSVTIP